MNTKEFNENETKCDCCCADKIPFRCHYYIAAVTCFNQHSSKDLYCPFKLRQLLNEIRPIDRKDDEQPDSKQESALITVPLMPEIYSLYDFANNREIYKKYLIKHKKRIIGQYLFLTSLENPVPTLYGMNPDYDAIVGQIIDMDDDCNFKINLVKDVKYLSRLNESKVLYVAAFIHPEQNIYVNTECMINIDDFSFYLSDINISYGLPHCYHKNDRGTNCVECDTFKDYVSYIDSSIDETQQSEKLSSEEDKSPNDWIDVTCSFIDESISAYKQYRDIYDLYSQICNIDADIKEYRGIE